MRLLAISALCATALGAILAIMRVGPIGVLSGTAARYVDIVRNTPLVLLFVVICYGLPEVGVELSFFTRAATALSLYTAAFVCEVLRSGINTVHLGQAEAARAIGLTFTQSLRLVILPQAVRSVFGPLASVFIALLKNTAVAEVFGITEATFQLDSLIRDYPDGLYAAFFGIAAGYILLGFAISAVARLLENRWAVRR
ncbi:amino acid ABC transporter permease [Streptomyces sp. ME19-01-6]|uniref:amino acid ABC transporter permease n=1 Tax=Streptomyces sp. ME19-01-6 TaxID=3028686 RepID=UPI0029A6A9AE|nr:amino acid ABC transporter permease [Streptomyces sp. ME19-01-6]MDX3233154.1 amino acid ABC transporter permease [Streptomyces sp. ME19-01-6]